ncbi:MAG: protein kinase, partial [Chloroflexota bacterium]|nr:protein kinase [Chloroflexota bacterium]
MYPLLLMWPQPGYSGGQGDAGGGTEVASKHNVMEPRVIADRYELRNRIGTGGMAQVYLGVDRVLGREVAVKVLHPESATDPTFVERFRREAKAAAALNHPNVAAVYDWGSISASDPAAYPVYYMVMEYVPGENIKELLERRGPLPEAEALGIASQVTSALRAAHQRGLVHRDVKPHNVLIDPEGQAKVVDFGIAHAVGLAHLTQTNAVSGTAFYLSPEQAQGRTTDARSDIYSLGVVLYEMLTGHVPFEGGSLVDVAVRHVHEQPVSPRENRPDISPATEAVVMKALAKDPGERYQTAADMQAALESARTRVMESTAVAEERTVAVALTAAAPTVIAEPAAGPAPAAPRVDTMVLGPGQVGPRPRMRTEERKRSTAWLMAVPALLLLLVAGGVFWVLSTHSNSRTATSKT